MSRQIEIPVHDNSIQTKRALYTNFPENSTLLNEPEKIVKVITDISEDLESNTQTFISNIPQYVEELQAVFNSSNITKFDVNLFKEEKYTVIDNTENLKKIISELLIRFDTNPRNYTKEDYIYLLGVLYKSLLYLYSVDTGSNIINNWSDTPRIDKVPSEKLVKETINLISAEWGNIQGNISDQTDLQEILSAKANTNDIPTNVSDLNNDSGYITSETDPTVPSWAKQVNKPAYTASEVGALPDDTFIPTNVSDLNNDTGYITSKDILVIDKTSDTSSSFVIDPNKMYMFGVRTSLTITLNAGEEGIVNEYMFQFTSGSTATTLTVPSSVVWLKDPNIQTGKKYAVSIENNLGIIGEWNNE